MFNSGNYNNNSTLSLSGSTNWTLVVLSGAVVSFYNTTLSVSTSGYTQIMGISFLSAYTNMVSITGPGSTTVSSNHLIVIHMPYHVIGIFMFLL